MVKRWAVILRPPPRWFGWVLVSWLLGCGHGSRAPEAETPAPKDESSSAPASSEGVLVLPVGRSEAEFSVLRLFEIAEALRPFAAKCFLQRAVETMSLDPQDPRGYTSIPEGQIKLRVRVSSNGTVVRLDVTDNGFEDPVVPKCFTTRVQEQTWPESEVAYPLALDVVYWVSMSPPGSGEPWEAVARRQTAEVSVRGKACVQGHLPPGEHTFRGLALIGSDGMSLASRVDDTPQSTPQEVRDCLARAFREVRLETAPEDFVRPVPLDVRYTVTEAGEIHAENEAWLRALHLEEKALRAERMRQAMEAEGTSPRPRAERHRMPPEDAAQPDPAVNEATSPSSEDAAVSQPGVDPGQGGIKLDLSGRGASSP